MKKIITLIMCVAFSATMFGQTAKVEERVKALEAERRVQEAVGHSADSFCDSRQCQIWHRFSYRRS